MIKFDSSEDKTIYIHGSLDTVTAEMAAIIFAVSTTSGIHPSKMISLLKLSCAEGQSNYKASANIKSTKENRDVKTVYGGDLGLILRLLAVVVSSLKEECLVTGLTEGQFWTDLEQDIVTGHNTVLIKDIKKYAEKKISGKVSPYITNKKIKVLDANNRLVTVRCPKCGSDIEFPVRKLIYDKDSIELQRDIISRKIFEFKCPKCRCNGHVNYPLVYFQPHKKVLIYNTTDYSKINYSHQDFFDWISESGCPDNIDIKNDDYIRRITISQKEFIEKIQILNNGRDDRIIEFVKLSLGFKANKKNKSLNVNNGHYRYEQGKEYIDFYECNDINYTVEIPEGFYDKVYSELIDEFSDKTEGANQMVDGPWLTSMLRLYSITIDKTKFDNIMPGLHGYICRIGKSYSAKAVQDYKLKELEKIQISPIDEKNEKKNEKKKKTTVPKAEIIKTWKIGSSSANNEYNGSNGNGDVIATLYSDGKLEIKGSGNTVVFNDRAPWCDEEYSKLIKQCTIKAKVKPLDMSNWFHDCINLSKPPKLPDSVVNITGTFEGCIKISSMAEIPDSIKIMNAAYKNCIKLKETVAFPEGVIYMQSTFEGCESLKKVSKIPDGVTDMSSAFKGCINLKTMPTIPDGVMNIVGAFEGCKSLTRVSKIPDGVTDMDSAFKGCINLKTMPTIPDGVMNIVSAFEGCESLVKAHKIPGGIMDISNLFKDCVNLIEMPIISKNVTNMNCTFEGCTSLTELHKIPGTVTNMKRTFKGCSSLTSAPSVPKGVVNMDNAFEDCAKLILPPEIPDSVESKAGIFNGCQEISSKYNAALELLKENTIVSLEEAETMFQMLSSFEDSKERIKECRIRIGKIRDEEEKERLEEEAREQERIAVEEKRKAKNRKTAIIVGLVLMCVVIAAISIVMIAKHVKNNSTYEEAIATGNAGHYKAAIGLLNEIPDYKDSTYYATKYKYKEAMDYGKKGNYRQALTLLKSISDYKDCDKEISKYKTLYKKVEPADICKNYEKYYIAYGAFSALRDKAETLSSSKYASATQKKKLLELNEFADLMDVAYYSYDDFSSKENGGFDYSTLKQLRGYKDIGFAQALYKQLLEYKDYMGTYSAYDDEYGDFECKIYTYFYNKDKLKQLNSSNILILFNCTLDVDGDYKFIGASSLKDPYVLNMIDKEDVGLKKITIEDPNTVTVEDDDGGSLVLVKE